MIVHWVYPSGAAISCPQAIGRNVAARLRRKYEVRQYDWDELRCIVPRKGDVLVGHPHLNPLTVFNASSRMRGWSRVIAMAPYNHGQPEQLAYLDGPLRRCDRLLAITGNYWFDRVAESPFAHWRPKMVHVDLAVDRADFPRVKGAFGPPGERRWLYVGHSGWTKNVGYLSEIARAMGKPERFGWMGRGSAIEAVSPLGFQDFRSASAQKTVGSYDFLITVGRSDANPATILEAMSWGLIPVCTAQSGYEGYPGIATLPLDDVSGAVTVMRRLEASSADSLEQMRAQNDRLLDGHFNWERVSAQVMEAIEERESPKLLHVGPTRTLALRWKELRSPYSPVRPREFARLLRSNLRRWLAGN